MNPESEVGPRRRWPRRLLALLYLLASVLSGALYARDLERRRGVEGLLRVSGLERARALDAETLALEPAWDLAADAVVSAAVRAEGPLPSAETLRSARHLMLEAAAARPGWPMHPYLLARCEEPNSTARARLALRLAANGAPGFDSAWSALGRANLAAWGALSAEERSGAEAALRRAARSPAFAGAAFPKMATALGGAKAAALLPEDSEVLEAAAGSLAHTGEVESAAGLFVRAEQAERRERIEDLTGLERLRGLGDVEGLGRGCIAWFDRYPLAGLGDADGRRDLARLLDLWPDYRFGSWPGDRRARILRFLLEGSPPGVSPETFRRTLAALTGVPDSFRARVELAAGDEAAARALAASSGEAFSAEWADYDLDLARRELAAGRIAEAQGALANLGFEARNGCEALQLRREVARRLGDAEEVETTERRLLTLREPAPDDWSSRGAVTLCVDPGWSAGRILEVAIGPGAPALLQWGWNGGRAGTLSVPAKETFLRAPLEGLSGQKTLWVSFLVGGEGRTLHGLVRRDS